MGLEIAEFVIALEDELEIRFDDASPFDAQGGRMKSPLFCGTL